MSDPVDMTKVGKYGAIQSALCELVSAESSLNMYPDPILLDPGIADDTCLMRSLYDGGAVGECTCDPRKDHSARTRYTSESDGNAKHSVEHLHAAFRLMQMAHHDQESLKMQVYKLVVQLKDLGVMPQVKTWLDVCSRCNQADLDDTQAFCAACTEQLTLEPQGGLDDDAHT